MDTKSIPRIKTEEKKRSSRHVMDSNEQELKWFLHRNRLLEKSYMMQNGMKKFWEGQFMEDWANNAASNLLELNSLASQSCNSPSAASESSSSLSTRESSSFSGRSEMLQSPDLFSRFSPDPINSFNHSEFLNKEKLTKSCKVLDESVRDTDLEYTVPFAARPSVTNTSEDWLSDSDESWASAESHVPSSEHGDDGKHDLNDVSKDLNSHTDKHSSTIKVSKDPKQTVLPKSTESRHILLECPNAITERSKVAKDERIAGDIPVLGNLYENDSLQCRDGASKGASFISSFAFPTNPSLAKKAMESLVFPEPDITSAQGSTVLGSKSSSLHSNARVSNVSINDGQIGEGITKQTVQPLSVFPESRQSRHSSAVRDHYASTSTQGYLRFAEQDGSLCYSFSVDASEEVYFARACKREKLNGKKNRDWIYTFHSRRENVKLRTASWKGWTKKEAQLSNLVGKMRVCNVKHGDTNRETRFILFEDKKYEASINGDGVEYMSNEPSTSDSGPQRRQSQDRSGSQHCELNVRTCGYANESQMVKGSHRRIEMVKESDCRVYRSRKVELAAIVITASLAEEKPSKENITKPSEEEGSGWGIKFLDKGLKGGWGMKFLDKSYAGSSPSPQSPARSAEQSNSMKLKNVSNSQLKPYIRISEGLEKKLGAVIQNQPKVKKIDVTVILPAGNHGFPKDEIDNETCRGPTPLLERWKSGGVCDCGGWDLGCGLSVLKCDTINLQNKQTSIALTNQDRVTWFTQGKPLKISTQGHSSNVALMVETIQPALFSLSFQARFSPIQAFATAVAMFHEQMTQHQ